MRTPSRGAVTPASLPHGRHRASLPRMGTLDALVDKGLMAAEIHPDNPGPAVRAH